MKKKFLIAVLVAVAVAIGFLRDYVFVSINQIIDHSNDASGKLSLLKWTLTFVFSILYLANTSALLYALFRSAKYIWIAVFAYILIFTVAFAVSIGGYLISSFENVYPFVRTVMGIAQSPIVMIILISASFLNESKLFVKRG